MAANQLYHPSCRVIPPEQQAEADELAAALAELQTATVHELQEVVGAVSTLNKEMNLMHTKCRN